ncbi:hypothetical protein [Bacillus sp. MMSF_3328]|uniref:hypothetical protein n=1 Tax=Bacillus sp. MMSF_3328 TaxID=3047080 RepID=UPI00273F8CC6|nr:hypothetical protein [Bacillus sp. MMSF_3328]
MPRDGLNIRVNIDPRAIRWFQSNAPQRLVQARKNAVEAAGMVWADEAKGITRAEDHIDTGLYINSIGYSTGSPSNPIWDIQEGAQSTKLTAGADVEYAESLEKRYSIFMRGLDVGKNRMQRVAETQVKNTLGL